jgi:hypothetical protein
MSEGPSLTPGQRLRVAHAVLVDELPQDAIARLLGVNGGRIGEAAVAFRWASSDDGFRQVYQLAKDAKAAEKEDETND